MFKSKPGGIPARKRAAGPESRRGSRAILLLAITCLSGLVGASSGAKAAKVLVIGFDGMDPRLLQEYRDAGLMPNFDRFIAAGDFKELGTAIPPQSPVAWSNFITGQNPGGHGIFDFIHRDPETLIPFLSTSQAGKPEKWFKLGSWKFPHGGGGVELLRHGRAFWEDLSEAGVDVTIFKIPANFPPVECEARTLSGMGTPDILGTYGIFSYITDNPPENTDIGGGRVITVEPVQGVIETEIPGPTNVYRKGDPASAIPLTVVIDPVNPAATFELGGDTFLLQEGEWSDWTTLNYKMLPLLKSVRGICRLYLMEVRPHFRLYVTPVQIDPVRPEMPISTPGKYARQLAEAVGLYYTQGLPEDTKALEEGVFSDDEYIAQADLVLRERMTQFRYELDRFQRLQSGFLFFYFNSPDQTCHMCWRNMDADSPLHAAADGKHADRIQKIYTACDEALGHAVDLCGDNSLIIAMSDHGFAPYHRSVHVNTWLLENGYLFLKPGVSQADVEYLRGIDWSRTRAYAIGINGLYLNLSSREKRGIVAPSARQALLEELVVKLEALQDPQTGQMAIKYAYRADEVYSGPYRDTGPDIILGYHRGYRGSNESALGEIPAEIFIDNQLKWSGDHCMAADEVPGIIVANRPILKPDPNLLDMAPTMLQLFGLSPAAEMVGRDIFAAEGVN